MTPNDAEQDLQQPTITLRTDRKLIRAGARSVRYLVVDVQAPPAPSRADRMPVNVALVLDPAVNQLFEMEDALSKFPQDKPPVSPQKRSPSDLRLDSRRSDQ